MGYSESKLFESKYNENVPHLNDLFFLEHIFEWGKLQIAKHR